MYADENGIEHAIYSFEDLLPHHARFVQRCFRGLHHFYEARSGNGLLEYVRGYNEQAALPHYNTCTKLLEVFEELQDEKIAFLIGKHMKKYGTPSCGAASDMWSLKSCRQSFACFRGSFVLDGDIVANMTQELSYRGKLVDMPPILGFDLFQETHHTGAVVCVHVGLYSVLLVE